MKKLFTLGLGLLFILASCKKEEKNDPGPPPDPPTYEDRLEGNWNLVSVKYNTEIPNPQNPFQTIKIDGEGDNVSGIFKLTQDPNDLEYNYSFTANINLGDTLSFDIPVQNSGMGTWTTTSDNSKIFVTEPNQEYTIDVLVNEKNRQVFATTFEQDIMGFFTADVDVELEFEKP